MSQSWLNRKRRYFKTNFESFFVLVESFSLRLTFENFPPLHWFCLKLTVFSDSVRSITKNTQPIRCKTRPKLGHLRLALERSFGFWVWLPLFTLNTHWLLVLLILVLIGCCGYSLLTYSDTWSKDAVASRRLVKTERWEMAPFYCTSRLLFNLKYNNGILKILSFLFHFNVVFFLRNKPQ